MDAISRAIFQNEVDKERRRSDYKALLRQIGRSGDLNSKVRESLVSIGRLVNFLAPNAATCIRTCASGRGP